MNTSSRKRLNAGVFIPAFSIILLAVIVGLVDNAALVSVAKKIDLVRIVTENGAVSGLWGFLQNLPLAVILVPLAIFTLIISFATAADSMTSTIASICTHDMRADEESPKRQKVIWGVSIAAIAYIMVAFGGGAQGVEGIKYLAAAGGFTVLFVFILIVASAARVFVFAAGEQEQVRGVVHE